MADKEIEAISKLNEILTALNDEEAQKRVISWAIDRFKVEGFKKQKEDHRDKKPTKKKSKSKAGTKPKIVRDLNLRPQGKPSFKDFFQEEKPNVGNQTYTVSVYYLEKILETEGITKDHVYTCMKEANQVIPDNLENAMLIVSSRYGTIDTSDTSNIRLTMAGENLVEHKLKKGKKGTNK